MCNSSYSSHDSIFRTSFSTSSMSRVWQTKRERWERVALRICKQWKGRRTNAILCVRWRKATTQSGISTGCRKRFTFGYLTTYGRSGIRSFADTLPRNQRLLQPFIFSSPVTERSNPLFKGRWMHWESKSQQGWIRGKNQWCTKCVTAAVHIIWDCYWLFNYRQVVDAFLKERFPTILVLNKVDMADSDQNIRRICNK